MRILKEPSPVEGWSATVTCHGCERVLEVDADDLIVEGYDRAFVICPSCKRRHYPDKIPSTVYSHAWERGQERRRARLKQCSPLARLLARFWLD